MENNLIQMCLLNNFTAWKVTSSKLTVKLIVTPLMSVTHLADQQASCRTSTKCLLDELRKETHEFHL